MEDAAAARAAHRYTPQMAPAPALQATAYNAIMSLHQAPLTTGSVSQEDHAIQSMSASIQEPIMALWVAVTIMILVTATWIHPATAGTVTCAAPAVSWTFPVLRVRPAALPQTASPARPVLAVPAS